jgi:hypothetical protein
MRWLLKVEAVSRPLPLFEDASVVSNTSMLRAKNSLSTNDLARGFALARVGTNEMFDFSAPAGANCATNWMRHGGATARTRLRFDDRTFPFGDGCLTNLTAFMFGVIAPDLYNEEKRIAPLQASLGFIAYGLDFVNAEIWELGRRGEEDAVESGSGVSPLQNEEDDILSRSGQETASTLAVSANLRVSV